MDTLDFHAEMFLMDALNHYVQMCPICNGSTRYVRLEIDERGNVYGYFCPNCSWDELDGWRNEVDEDEDDEQVDDDKEQVDYSDGF
jgi:hypothetical protein